MCDETTCSAVYHLYEILHSYFQQCNGQKERVVAEQLLEKMKGLYGGPLTEEERVWVDGAFKKRNKEGRLYLFFEDLKSRNLFYHTPSGQIFRSPGPTPAQIAWAYKMIEENYAPKPDPEKGIF